VAEAMTPRLFSEQTRRENPGLIDAIQRTISQIDPRGIAAASRGMAERADFSAELPRIACPTLVLVGAEDVITPPSEMQAMARAIPHAQFEIIPHAGHLSPLEQPEAVNAAIEKFLQGFE
jgi:pimeloyl-ACP methyl ester carboxylesterase